MTTDRGTPPHPHGERGAPPNPRGELPGDLVDRYAARAKEVLDPAAWDYYAGGAEDERTLTDNVEAWRRLRLRPRVLRDVSAVSTATTVLGSPVDLPVLVAPTALHGLAHDEGERETARGAAAAGALMVVSTLASRALEDVAAAAPEGRRWFQLYVRADRGFAAQLVERAEAAGYGAIVLTVDLPVLGHRTRDRHEFPADRGRLGNFETGTDLEHGAALGTFARDVLDPSVAFGDLEALCASTSLPVIVKGVLRADDAASCVDAGAAAVVVSNHGGRQLDTAIAGADALPEVVAAVGDRVEVYVDGGVRRGTDVLKALALGARAVLVGRPVLWGLAVEGQEGVAAVLGHLRAELERSMALAGARDVSELTPDLVVGAGGVVAP